ncbi:DUF3606 domain-containing protein [Ramlibacter rhizophilus]|uniref:DUF3606 domain-containing protein n=1 Tax=Ramlibacter rhizophilus TaxID=1781167 RepID=A0A4Z0BRI9_9BURK|nr:DUF3606 domain-containing protein [Ramlibacter rhizophilus]TFZ01362.1 DUF3606 domain-containing protein [Ramlibacter rhizophilus]
MIEVKQDKPAVRDADRIDISHDYAVCAWARQFNVSQQAVREAVAAVGDRAGRVRVHLQERVRSQGASERPRSD